MSSRKEGLTTTYNRFHDSEEKSSDIQKLRDLHLEMDKAVAAAYDWDDLDLDHDFYETKQGIRFTISEAARREVLQRLLKLNHERYEEEVKQGLHDKKKKKKAEKPDARKPRRKGGAKMQKATLFGEDADGTEDVWYFAYGSNLLRDQKVDRTGSIRTGAERPRVACLKDYRFAFNKQGASGQTYANVVPCTGDEVLGVVYRCDQATLSGMDPFEPGYERTTLQVVIEDGSTIEAVTYVAKPSRTVDDTLPNSVYLDKILDGAREHGLPESYIEKLHRLGTIGGGDQ